MANMQLIEAKTVGSGGVPYIDFSNIPQTFTDLKLVISARDNRAGQPNDDIAFRVGYNGTLNTGNIYTYKRLWGNSASAGSDGQTGVSVATFGMMTGATATANVFGSNEIYISKYASSSAKSIYVDGVSENNSTTSWLVLNSAFVNTANPITDIRVFGADASTLQEFSTFYLYGIQSNLFGAKATGGSVYKTTDYFYHVFASTGIFAPTQSITADVLVVAGGGQGGGGNGGGGGAGGVLLHSAQALTATNYTVTVGAGGSGGLTNSNGISGNPSQFGSLTASVGGGGGGGYSAGAALSGGSGGGGGTAGNITPGAGTSGQGFAGGSGHATDNGAGGGGGAGAVGGAGTPQLGGAGGIGTSTYSSWGTDTQTGQSVGNVFYYAGGGGGANDGTVGEGIAGVGGAGGGGKGGTEGGNVQAVAGTINTGGGGGGEGGGGAGANGGSGIVIVRYAV